MSGTIVMKDAQAPTLRYWKYGEDQMIISAKVNPASESWGPGPDASDVVFPSTVSIASGRHFQCRLRPDVMSDLTDILLPSHISCSSPAPYLTS